MRHPGMQLVRQATRLHRGIRLADCFRRSTVYAYCDHCDHIICKLQRHRYLRNVEAGSHGGVNVPTLAGDWLYQRAQVGTTIQITE